MNMNSQKDYEEYGVCDKELNERFELRSIRPEEEIGRAHV